MNCHMTVMRPRVGSPYVEMGPFSSPIRRTQMLKSHFFFLFLLIEAFPGIVTYFFILVLKSMTLIKTQYGT